MAATQDFRVRTRASRFSSLTSRILSAALLSGALVVAQARAEAPLFKSDAPVAADPPRFGVEDPSPTAAVHPLMPLSAAGVAASASLQSAGLIATGPLGVSAALHSSQAASPFNLRRTPKAGALDSQVRLLASTIFAEARSEGSRGMRAVAHVIKNRVGPRFGRTMAEVIFKPWQFSAWNRGDPNRAIALNPDAHARRTGEREAWASAQAIAREVLEGRSVDPTNGALFYHTLAVNPRWASAGVGKRVIGHHIFYRDVRG